MHRKFRRHRSIAIAAALMLVAGGCGDRLTAAQRTALNGSGGGGGGSLAAGGQGGTNTDNSGGTSGGTGPTQAVGSTGSSGSSGSSGSHGSRGSSSGSSGGTTRVITKAGTSGTGPSTVTQAGNPLAGPGGKVCASGSPGSGPGVTASTITIGNIATVNGPVPGLFAGARYGTQAAVDYVNQNGGICGRKLVLNAADDQFDQATDQQEASQMSGNVLAMVGSFSLQDGGIAAGAPGVPDLGEALSNERFNSPSNFSPQPQPPGYNTGEYQFIKSQSQWASATQHMALLVENTPQTANTGKWEQEALQSAGYKFVFTDTNLQPTDPTFNGDVQKMQQAGVQGVVFQATATIIGQLANQMYQAGIKVVLGNWCPSAYDPAYLQNAGPGSAGTVLSQSLALYQGEDAGQVPMVATFDQWYSRVNPGQTPDIFALYGWASTLMLAQALNEEGSVTRSSLLAGIKSLGNFDGDGLIAAGNPVTKTPPSCYVLIDVQGGKFVRDPSTPSGFKCAPAGYFRAT